MNKNVSRMMAIAAALWLTAFGRTWTQSRPESIQLLLPRSGEVPGWTAADEPLVYVGDTLYKYMDGGAEIYMEYGFRQLAVQEFRNAAGRSIVVEVFEMNRDAAAFGMYTFKSASVGRPVDLGREGQVAEYYLSFWSHDVLVTITGQDQDQETLAGIAALGRAASARIPRGGERPQEVRFLPDKGRVPWSLRYLLGPIGVRNSYAFSAEDVFRSDECLKADYQGGESLFIFLYGTTEDRAGAFSRVTDALEKGSRYSGSEAMGRDRVRAKDISGREVRVQALDKALIVGIGGRDWSLVEETAQRIRA